MKITNRMFSYPVLGSKGTQNYFSDKANFKATITEVDSNKTGVRKIEIKYECSDKSIISGIKNKNINIVALLESTNSLYRESYKFSEEENENKCKYIEVEDSKIDDTIGITVFAYSCDNIEYASSLPSEILENYKFKIQKNDIVAFDDAYDKIPVYHPDVKIEKKKSIFTFHLDADHNYMSYDYDNDYIVIRIPEAIYNSDEFKNKNLVPGGVISMMYCLPAFSIALKEYIDKVINKGEEDFKEVYAEFQNRMWFKTADSILNKLEKKSLDDYETVIGLDYNECAQKLMNDILAKTYENMKIYSDREEE